MSKVDVSKCEFHKDNYCDCYKDIYGDWYHKCADYELNNCYFKQLQQLKQENKELKNKLSKYEDNGGITDECKAWANEAMGSRKILEKLKPILEFYANMRIGFERANGTSAREVLLEVHNGGCHTGRFKMIYDPNKAKEGLEIIKSHLEDSIE